ncbi:MAG TPA: hypothetical protein VFM46_06160, partial [Pseudomonadales bacterium]|nr:hypothetical protein [Pseudomonadales bacterium]
SGGVSSTGGPTGSGNSGGTGGTNANGGVDPAVAAAQTAALQAVFNSTIAPFLESKHCALCHSVLVPNLVLKTGSSAAARNANFLAVRTYIEQASDLFKYGFHDKPSRNGIRHDGGKYFENGDATSVAFKTFIDQVIAARPAGYGMPVGADALEMEFLTSISPVMEKEECSFCHKGSGLGFGGLQPFTTLAAREINYAVVRSFIESSPSKYLFHDKPAERGTLHVGGRSFHNGDATSVAFKTFIDHVIAAKNNASGDPAPTTGATPLETKFLTSVSPILQEKSCIGCHKVGTNYGFVLTATDYSANFSSVRNFIENSPKKYLFHDKPSETGVRHVGGKFFSAGDATSIAFKSFIDDVMASKGATN